MDCGPVKEILPSYVAHTASDEDIQTVEEHLCVCHSCREFLAKNMDKPAMAKPKNNRVPPQESGSKMGVFEYLVLGVALVVAGFLIFLFLKK